MYLNFFCETRPRLRKKANICSDLTDGQEPHKIPFYLYDLSTIFHSYWSKGNEDNKYRFIENGKIKRKETLVFIYLTAIVIKNGMSILGVSLPEKM